MKPFKLYFKSMVAILVAMLLISFSIKNIPEKLLVKINTAVKEAYQVETFKMEVITVSAKVNQKTKTDFGAEHFFKLNSNGVFIGYLYLGEAPSKKNVFDYIVMFDKDLSIKKSKVLIYREDYGRQIGSQRWLKQFIGLTSNDTVTYGENVDAISGATISAKSMTGAIKNLLQGISVLKADGIVP